MQAAEVKLLNVSYDPTRELYEVINRAFAESWKKQSGDTVIVGQSHGGSSKQARAVIEGLEADVVTLSLVYDLDALVAAKKVAPSWRTRLPNRASPSHSPIVFLVRRGNPKKIRDWNDLTRPGVEVITPNPKTGGGAKINYLAAWAYALKQPGGSDQHAFDLVRQIYHNVKVLDSGARGSSTTFVERGIGDVLIAWENEALLVQKARGGGQFEVVAPSVSLLADLPVSMVDAVVDKHGTRTAAEAYLKFLYTPVAQRIFAEWGYRPLDAALQKQYSQFHPLKLYPVEDIFGSDWAAIQQKHFAEGGQFDRMSSHP